VRLGKLKQEASNLLLDYRLLFLQWESLKISARRARTASILPLHIHDALTSLD